MATVIKVYDKKSCLNPFSHNLNVRQLLNPIFFERACRHVDMKRQQSRRQRSKDLAQARRLKATQGAIWVPALPETHAWEDWFDLSAARCWQKKRHVEGRWSV
jgi:hypothetical protein